jgi:hypothetical protein
VLVVKAPTLAWEANNMEQELLKSLAHFKILFKKEKGVPADLEKMLSDPAYGRQLLAQAEESENETLVVLALAIKDKLGYLKVAAAPAPAPAKIAAEPKPVAADAKKYMYGPRS